MKKREPSNAPPAPPGPDDPDAFAREMADVVRLPPDPRGRVRAVRPVTRPLDPTSSPADPVDSDIDNSDDRGFTADGVDRRELRKLKRGDYAPEDTLDLHGMTAAIAAAGVARFIDNSRHRGHRCICIVHGRGLHSERKEPILKSRVRELLRVNQAVLAYRDAAPSDGGPGAVYVLLRR